MPTADSAYNPAIAVVAAQRAIRARCDLGPDDWPILVLHSALPSRYAADAKSNIPVLAYARKPQACTHVDLREAASAVLETATVIPRSTFSFRPSEWQ
jgi:hypothetical protein